MRYKISILWYVTTEAGLPFITTCSLEKKTLRTYGYSPATLLSAQAIVYFQSFPQVTRWQLIAWSSDPIQSLRAENTNVTKQGGKNKKMRKEDNQEERKNFRLKGTRGFSKSSTFTLQVRNRVMSRWKFFVFASWCPSGTQTPVPPAQQTKG